MRLTFAKETRLLLYTKEYPEGTSESNPCGVGSLEERVSSKHMVCITPLARKDRQKISD